MKFLLMIFGSEASWQGLSEKEQYAFFGEHGVFSDALKKEKKYIDGAALQPEVTGKRVRRQGSQRVITDGPFAETKEVIGGYYLIEAKDLPEAVEWSKRVPLLDGEFVEVRPLVDMAM